MRVRLRQSFAFPADDRSLHVEPADELGPLIGIERRANAGRCHARGRYLAQQARCTAIFGVPQRVTTPGLATTNKWWSATVLTAQVTNTAHHLGRRSDADEWTADVFAERDGRRLCALSHTTSHRQPRAELPGLPVSAHG